MMLVSRVMSVIWARTLRFSWGRVIVLLALVWAGLQVLHMTLLGRLEARKAELQRSRLTKILHDESLQLFNTMRARIEAAQIVDSSGEYKIVNRLYKGRGEEEERNEGLGKRRAAHNAANNGDGGTQGDVTLVTQCSVNHMHHLIGLSERWQGPMSVAVFAPDRHSVIAMEIIVKLFQCVISFRQNVSVHLVYPFVQAPDMSLVPVTLPTDFSSCVDLHNELLAKWQAKISNYALEGIKFPNNLLRNVALSNSRTKYVFVVDIDMLPSATLHREFSSFLARQLSQTEQLIDDKTAFVVPAFEISSDVVPPADKTGLLRQWQQHKLRPFYSETCWKCHRWTDYEAWRNLSVSGLEVGYEVEWRDPWEPFYIAPNSVPKYDERFKQYGFNRISQVCELHIAGFKFSVLNNAFLVHQGFKTADGFHASKAAEQDRNRLLFRQFKEELKAKYPDSERRCY